MATEETTNTVTATAASSELVYDSTAISVDKEDLYVTVNTDALVTPVLINIPTVTAGAEIKNIKLGSTTYPINLPSNANANVNCVTTNAFIVQKSSNPVLTINNNGYLTTNESSLKISTNGTQTQITENGIFYNTHKAIVGGPTSMLANVPYMIDFDIISATLSGTGSATVNVYASAFNMSYIMIIGAMPYNNMKPYFDYYVSYPSTYSFVSATQIALVGTSSVGTANFTAKLMITVVGY